MTKEHILVICDTLIRNSWTCCELCYITAFEQRLHMEYVYIS